MAKHLIRRNAGYKGMAKIARQSSIPRIVLETVTYPNTPEEFDEESDPDFDPKKGSELKSIFANNSEYLKNKYNFANYGFDGLQVSIRWINQANVFIGEGKLDLSRKAEVHSYSPNMKETLEQIRAELLNLSTMQQTDTKPTTSIDPVRQKMIEFAGKTKNWTDFTSQGKAEKYQDYGLTYDQVWSFFEGKNLDQQKAVYRELLEEYAQLFQSRIGDANSILTEVENIEVDKAEEEVALIADQTILENTNPIPSNPLSDEFFRMNPSKILGEASMGTDRFGGEIMVVKGGMENLKAIDVPEVIEVDIDNPVSSHVSSTINEIILTEGSSENFDIAINAQESRIAKKAVKKVVRRKKAVDEVEQEEIQNEMIPFDEFLKTYNPNINDDELAVWVWWNQYKGNPLGGEWTKYTPVSSNDWFTSMLNQGYLCFDYETGKYVPASVYYSGNILNKISQALKYKNDQAEFPELPSGQWDRQYKKLTEIKPKALTLSSLDPNNRLIIAPISEMAKTYTITKMSDGVELDKEMTLQEAFVKYLNSIPESDFELPVRAWDIRYRYLENESDKSRRLSKEEKFEIKKNARIEGDRLFQKFLYDELFIEDKVKIEHLWNSKYNSWVDIDLSKIPVALECSRKFKKGALRFRAAQIEGVAFQSINGTGITAYDVGVGKGHLLTSKILTPSGYVEMKDIHIGSKVIGKNGLPTNVTGVYPLGKVQCYKVSFSDGTFAEVSDEHLWNVQTINYRSKYKEKWDTVRTCDIIDKLQNYRGDYQYSIPMVEPVNFEAKELPLHPYLLGLLLGDGGMSGSNCIGFSNPEKDIVQKLSHFLPDSVELRGSNNKDFRISRKSIYGANEVVTYLRNLGLQECKSEDKFIPEVYKINSYENRLQLLRGLLDTDGYIKGEGKDGKKGCTIQYTTVSEKLCNDIVFLVQSFGGIVCVSSKIPSYTHNGEKRNGQLAYTITIRLPKGIVPVSSEKQLAKFVEKTKYQPVRFITSIEDIGFQEAQCIRVDAEDHLYCCEHFIVTHNTITLIALIGHLIQSGQSKRPLIIVPNPTYEKWKKEINGIYDSKGRLIGAGALPQYKINDLKNLGVDYIGKLYDSEGNFRKIEEYTITIMTYEALEKIGFNEEKNKRFIGEMMSILDDGSDSKKAREVAVLQEKAEKYLGKAQKETIVDFDMFDFDFIGIDEAHNFKNVFTSVKGTEGEGKYYDIQGSVSARGIKAFFMTQWIFDKTNGKNVCLLTATPFTNNPLEVFSMLAMCSYKELKRRGIGSLREFFDTYVKQTYEVVYGSDFQFKEKAVIKQWNNRISLQSLIFSFINYKSGEDAGIQRPNKIVLPLFKQKVNNTTIELDDEDQISTFLTPTDAQKQFLKDIEAFVLGEAKLADICSFAGAEEGCEPPESILKLQNLSDEDAEAGKVLRALSFSRQVTLSPYLYACNDICGNPNSEGFYKDYIETSPKLLYTMKCIASVKKWHEDRNESVSGQIIYMDAGKDYFKFIKEYLVKEIGYDYSEVEFITSEISQDKREDIKKRFLDGEVKIVIGTSSIKEGIDLQERTSVLYVLWLDWRPTDLQQLEGRAWRFGNMFANVRIVIPLLENSIDPFMFQKLEEKTARINDIFDRAGKTNVLDIEEFNPEELKFGLLTDPIKKAKEQIKFQVKMLEVDRSKLKAKLEGVSEITSTLHSLDYSSRRIISQAQYKHDYLVRYFSNRTVEFKNSKGEIEEKVINAALWLEEHGMKTSQDIDIVEKAIDFGKYYDKLTNQSEFTFYAGSYRDSKKKLSNLENSILKPRNLSLNDDLNTIKSELTKDIEEIDLKIADLKNDENVQVLVNMYIEEMKAIELKRKTLDERVDSFASLNDSLLSEYMNYGTDQAKKIEDFKVVKEIEKEASEMIEAENKKALADIERESTIANLKAAIEIMKELLPDLKGKEKKDMKAAIEITEETLDLI